MKNNNNLKEFKQKFIGYIDILGWKQRIEEAEKEIGMPLSELCQILDKFSSLDKRNFFEKYGPEVCPESAYINKNLDFQISSISDSLLVSSEISPAGVINLITFCWEVIMNLLNKGLMCRGYITKGEIHHEKYFMGTGYHKALKKEKEISVFKKQTDERGTPFVEVDSIVCDYIKSTNDSCVKKVFSCCIKEDETGVALFPFQRLAHSFIIAGPGYKCDLEEEREENKKVCLNIEQIKKNIMKFVDPNNPSAVSKAEHYIEALSKQVTVCQNTEKIIDALAQPLLL